MAEQANWKFVCLTAHYWGAGKTADEALAQCKKAGGSAAIKKAGYITSYCHPDTEVSCIDGSLSYPEGHSPVLVSDRIKKGAKQ